MNGRVFLLVLGVVGLFAMPGFSGAQDGERSAARRGPGIELALHGNTTLVLGHAFHLEGVTYEVRELADLQRLAQARVHVAVFTGDQTDSTRRTLVIENDATSDASGRFFIDLAMPSRRLIAPSVKVTVSHRGLHDREFEFGANASSPVTLDVLTDRELYEPGETVHIWNRSWDAMSRLPIARRELRLSCHDAQGRLVGERVLSTSNAGSATFDLALPANAPDGIYQISATLPLDGVNNSRQFRVGRRTVERVMLSAELEQSYVRPGGTLRGRVNVRTSSGAPIRGANIEIRVPGASAASRFVSDANGVASFSVDAPSYLSGDFAMQALAIRAVHEAHGTLRTSLSYRLVRSTYTFEASAANGALAPEVDSSVYVLVQTAAGEPAPAGLTVRAHGTSIRNGSATATTNARGLVIFPVRVPRNDAAENTSAGGECGGNAATSFEVTVEGDRPVSARVNACVAVDADVIPRVSWPIADAGSDLSVEIQRRPRAASRAVLVEAVSSNHVVVASAWVDAASTRTNVHLPEDVQGVVRIRARALTPDNVNAPLDQTSPALTSMGMSDALYVRPSNAFGLSVEAPSDAVHVRTHARVALRASHPSEGAYASVLVRDLAAHGGEHPWQRAWIEESLDRALIALRDRSESTPLTGEQSADLVFLRVALAATLTPENQPRGVAPLNPTPWESDDLPVPGIAPLRDPIAARAELLRRGIGQTMSIIEQAIANTDSDAESMRGIVQRNGNRVSFDPNIIETLVNRGTVDEGTMSTLGNTIMRVEMLTRADPSFTFDNVARRIARGRLVRLMQALVAFTDPDDVNAAREASTEPPERWLSKMLDRGRISAQELNDPWGRPFAFRRAAGQGPRIVIAEAAPLYELVSAGPDGAFGSADDVRDPFARVVTRGTPYAVASGEDALMQSLSTLSASDVALASMLQAFDALSLQASEEQRRGVVIAGASEMDSDGMQDAPLAGLLMGDIGSVEEVGAAGYGVGYGRGAGGMSARSAAAPPAEAPAESADDQVAEQSHASNARLRSAMASMGETIREEFPSTLYFAGEVALDRSGATMLDFPVADALTTYRIEAIAWTTSGWVTSARGELRVDQDASVDAPVPPFATVGDLVRVPVRVANRTALPLDARVEIVAEGGLSITPVAAQTLTVAPRDAGVVLMPISLRTVGDGSLIVRVVRASNGAALDAVRRPLQVLADARLVRATHEALFQGDHTLAIDIPSDAVARGTSAIRITRGSTVFGDLRTSDATISLDLARRIWALRVAGMAIPQPLRDQASAMVVSYRGNPIAHPHADAFMASLTVLAGIDDNSVSDEAIRLALEFLNNSIPSDDVMARVDPSQRGTQTISTLQLFLALAPVARLSSTRNAFRDDITRLLARMSNQVDTYMPSLENAHESWATAALAHLIVDARSPVALEFIRRAERGVIRTRDRALLDPDSGATLALERVTPTATMALAYVLLSRDADALPFLRDLVAMRGARSRFSANGLMLAATAMLKLNASEAPTELSVSIDGQTLALHEENGVTMATLPSLPSAGAHQIVLHAGARSAAFASIDVRYGRPWSSVDRDARLDVSLDGELGARDGRAALRLTVANRGMRVMREPTIDIDLPAGTELDEETKAWLREFTGEEATIEERTLHVRVRALAPGAFVRIPLALRWSLGGTLRGLGLSAYDAGTESDLRGLRPAHVVASRSIEIADRGNEPAQQEVETSPEPEPIPDPIPLLPPIRPLGPVAEVSR